MDDKPNLTTAKLNQTCTEILSGKIQEHSFNQGLCIGIILGVEDNAHYDKKICVPKNVSIHERVQVVTDYIVNQPTRKNEAFASLVYDALAEKWPCNN